MIDYPDKIYARRKKHTGVSTSIYTVPQGEHKVYISQEVLIAWAEHNRASYSMDNQNQISNEATNAFIDKLIKKLED